MENIFQKKITKILSIFAIQQRNLNINNALAIDLGINNLVTAVSSNGKTFIIDGKRLKSINQWYNKQNAHLQSVKDKQNIGKRATNKQKANNQTFVNIPYGQLRFKLEYLCEINGIVFVKQEESYTSKASFWDKDNIPIYNNDNPQSYTFSGKRIHRGMYQCLYGKCLNADVNGALNILRKSNVVSLVGLYSRGEVDTPVRIRIAQQQVET